MEKTSLKNFIKNPWITATMGIVIILIVLVWVMGVRTGTTTGVELSARKEIIAAQNTYYFALKNAYGSSTDAVYDKVDQIFNDPKSQNPTLVFKPTIISAASLETGRVEVEDRLANMRDVIATMSTSSPDFAFQAEEIKLDLGEIQLFLDNATVAVNALNGDSKINEKTLASWKTNITFARNEVNSAARIILEAERALSNAEKTYQKTVTSQ